MEKQRNDMMSSDEYYALRYGKVCLNHVDYLEFAQVYATYVLTYVQCILGVA